MLKRIVIYCAIALLLLLQVIAQEERKNAIEFAVESKDFAHADSILKKDIPAFFNSKNFDTLVYFIPFIGATVRGKSNPEKAAQEIFKHVELITKAGANTKQIVSACRNAAEFFANAGQAGNGYKASELALAATLKDPKHDELEVARCEYNLGVYAYREAKIAVAFAHHKKSFDIRERNKDASLADIYFSSSAMGALLWNNTKYDSATFYFNRALDVLKKTPQDDLNKYYRPGNVESNLASIYNAEGKTSEAIAAQERAIANFQKFVASKDPHPKKQSALEGVFEGIDNLAGFYKQIGDYAKAGQMLRYSYEQKLEHLPTGHSGIFISEVLLGQHFQANHEYDSALHYLQTAIDRMHHSDGDYLFWEADASHSLALTYEGFHKKDSAAAAYGRSEKLFDQSYQGIYDDIYMDFLRSAAIFSASNGDYAKAKERANKIYDYLIKVGEASSLQGFYQLLNIAEINFISKHYKEAGFYSARAISTVNEKMKEGSTLLDSIKMEVFKPKAILLSAESDYEQQVKRDSQFLKRISARLQDALAILERRKIVIDDASSINTLVADHHELIEFDQKVELELYNLTHESSHLDNLINLQEAGLYNRIRSRLDNQHAVAFTGLPAAIQKDEAAIKNSISTALRANKADTAATREFISALNKWNNFQAKVKESYPAYYNLRYATIFKSAEGIQKSLAANTTVVRYFYVDSNLLALVMKNDERKLFALDGKLTAVLIDSLEKYEGDETKELAILTDLYKLIWQPLEKDVANKHVTIIPDGNLFRLNFEMLCSKPATTYKDLAQSSLLSEYFFSYNYSLFLLDSVVAEKQPNTNYVAFAPGFSDRIKEDYVLGIKDSLNLDRSYLELLPQPNTVRLVEKLQGSIGGDLYVNEASTQNSFVSNAGGHKIIHVGTHADYDNIHPGQSGLVFAKNLSKTEDDNFLSIFDIYNINMQSDLMVLTACESGRTGYQDGEGMISLANAFSYAGSKKLLTALWKIDEQASNIITEYFIANVRGGMATDEALQKAKLDYLKNAEGRTLAPSYWAGLIMMGQPAKINFETASSGLSWWWMIGGGLLGALVFYRVMRK